MSGFNKLNKTAALATLAAGLLFVGYAGAGTTVKNPVLVSKASHSHAAIKHTVAHPIGWYNGNIREFLV